jgi:hypothetical protein
VEVHCSASKWNIIPHAVPTQSSIVQWANPPEGFVKINWDASVNKREKTIRVRVVVCDFDGGGHGDALSHQKIRHFSFSCEGSWCMDYSGVGAMARITKGNFLRRCVGDHPRNKP